MEIKICAVVVWYNPKNEMLQNIKSYEKFVNKIYIIDNSNISNEKLIKLLKNKKIEYVKNLKNIGIAKALNKICDKAINDGYGWILTMDQDSFFEKNQIEDYIEYIKNKENINEVAIISPRYKYFSDENIIKYNEKYEEVSKVITSGNLLNLDVYREAGRFNEDFFIDQVDFEFCKKIKKIKKKIIQINTVFLNHKLGDLEKRNFFIWDILVTNHSHIRRYYMSRNILYMTSYYPELKIKYYIFLILDFIKIIIYEKNKKIKIKYFFKGILDFKKRKVGELK